MSTAASSVLYVAADLTCMEVGAEEIVLGLAQDISQRDVDQMRAYRRLDLDWYRWLFHQMARAQRLAECGTISKASWDVTRARFRVVWHWLRTMHTAEEISAAEACYPDARYAAPEVRDTLALLDLFRQPFGLRRLEAVHG